MRYSQFPNQPIINFIRFIDRKFVAINGRNFSPKFLNFRRVTKIECLLHGMLPEIYKNLKSKFKNIESEIENDMNHENYFSWNELIEGAREAEWLVKLNLKHWKPVLVLPTAYYDPEIGFFVDKNRYVIVYTDGACSNNGNFNAQAGVGVWFAPQHFLNKSMGPLYSDPEQKPFSNIDAEMMAIIEAFKIAKQYGVKRLSVHTDSKFVIDSFEKKWINKWLYNGWIKADGDAVENQNLFRELLILMEDIDAYWVHVDRNARIEGNMEADRLAKSAANSRGGMPW